MTWVVYMTLDDGTIHEEPFESYYLAQYFQELIPYIAMQDEWFARVRKSFLGVGKPEYIGGYFGAN